MVNTAKPAYEEALQYWLTTGEEWDSTTAEHPAFGRLQERFSVAYVAATHPRYGGLRAVVWEINGDFTITGGTVDVTGRFDGKSRLSVLEFDLPEGPAFNYRPLDAQIPRIGWSANKFSGHDGYSPQHNFEADGFMFEANRERVEEVLEEIGKQLP